MSDLIERVRNLYGYATEYKADDNVMPHVQKVRALNFAEFDRMMAQVRAEAWEEGWNAGHYDYVSIQDGADLTKNPYRSDDDDD